MTKREGALLRRQILSRPGVPSVEALAVVFEQPRALAMRTLTLDAPTDTDVIIDVQWTGISTGTERLLFTGDMPPFPGLGYPLVPGYESVGTVIAAGTHSTRTVGDIVFVAGARCFGDTRGLFGGAAKRLVVPGPRTHVLRGGSTESSTLLSLAATAHHALVDSPTNTLPDLIVGHGALGRLAARLVLALGGSAPTVWEIDSRRTDGARGYDVTHPEHDTRRDYRCILDCSGADGLLDTLIARLAKGGEIVLGGFYHAPVQFTFAPAFMRAARLRIAAEFSASDVEAVQHLQHQGAVSLDGIVSHRRSARHADDAYRIAFSDPACVKMVLDWSDTE
jgi:bacteriochlorophyllide a dehydrogenase